MNFAPIAPLSLVKTVAPTSKYLMALPAMADDPDYVALYKKLRQNDAYVMLDNGLSEDKEPRDAEDLLEVIDRLLPSEVILPDYLRDGPRTVRASKATLDYLRVQGRYYGSFMAVPHGMNLAEYMACIYDLLAIREVQCIGLSKYFPQSTGLPRRALLNSIAGDGLQHRQIKWHLLGVCESVEEIRQIALDFPWLRGIDTCYPVLASMMCIDITANPKIVTSPKGFFRAGTHEYWPRKAPPDMMYDLLRYNLKAFDNACHGRAAR